MIRYALRCDQNHSFEAWFRNSDAFDAQAKAGAVTCPDCGSAQVEKSLMAPRVPQKANKAPTRAQVHTAIRAYREKVLTETEDVGRRFPEEARKMHEGDKEHRAIRGDVTPDEAKSLVDDGVPVAPLPPEPPKDN